jgi:hypothetical protein
MATFFTIRYRGYEPGMSQPSTALFATRMQAETYINAAWGSKYAAQHGFWIDYATWEERERALTDLGIYLPPPWVHESFWYNSDHIWRHHYVHISLNDPLMLAYTENPIKGEADRQTMMKPARYLAKFFPDLTQKQLTFYAEWFAAGEKPDTLKDIPLKFAREPDEIVNVYQYGPQSCMKDDDSVKVYGAGDLAVAYLEENSHRFIARALCWPAKKAFGRVYPNTCDWSRDRFGSKAESQAAYDSLFARMRALGYTHISEKSGIMNGARLLKEHIRDDKYVMPYLDNAMRFGDHDDNAFWTMGSDEAHSADNTDGTAYTDGGDDDDQSCEHCNDTSYGLSNVFTSHDGRYPGQSEYWCDSCRDIDSFYCEATNETYADNVGYVETPDHEYWVRPWAERHGFQCARNETWHRNSERVTMHDGAKWCQDAVEAHAFYCDKTGQYFDEDIETSYEVGHEQWSATALALHGFTCSYDDQHYPKTDESVLWPGFPAELDSDDSISAEDRVAHRAPEIELEEAA